MLESKEALQHEGVSPVQIFGNFTIYPKFVYLLPKKYIKQKIRETSRRILQKKFLKKFKKY
jgi:hypothetical protein